MSYQYIKQIKFNNLPLNYYSDPYLDIITTDDYYTLFIIPDKDDLKRYKMNDNIITLLMLKRNKNFVIDTISTNIDFKSFKITLIIKILTNNIQENFKWNVFNTRLLLHTDNTLILDSIINEHNVFNTDIVDINNEINKFKNYDLEKLCKKIIVLDKRLCYDLFVNEHNITEFKHIMIKEHIADLEESSEEQIEEESIDSFEENFFY